MWSGALARQLRHESERQHGCCTLPDILRRCAVLVAVGGLLALLIKNVQFTTHRPGAFSEGARSAARIGMQIIKNEILRSRCNLSLIAPSLKSPVLRPSVAVSGSCNDFMFFSTISDAPGIREHIEDYLLVRYYRPDNARNRLRRAEFPVVPSTTRGVPLVFNDSEPPPRQEEAPSLGFRFPQLSISVPQSSHWYPLDSGIAPPLLNGSPASCERDIIVLEGPDDEVRFAVIQSSGSLASKEGLAREYEGYTFKIKLQVIQRRSHDSATPIVTAPILIETVDFPRV